MTHKLPFYFWLYKLAQDLAVLHELPRLGLGQPHVVHDEAHAQLRHQHGLDKGRGAASGNDPVVDGAPLQRVAELADQVVAHGVEAARAVVARVEALLALHRPRAALLDVAGVNAAKVRAAALDNGEQVAVVRGEARLDAVPVNLGVVEVPPRLRGGALLVQLAEARLHAHIEALALAKVVEEGLVDLVAAPGALGTRRLVEIFWYLELGHVIVVVVFVG